MKKIIIFGLILGGLFLAAPVFAQEQIDNFDVTIKINQDASINVSEKIDYNFGDLERHGIYRFIPIKYKARGGNFKLRISDISVVDENDMPYNAEITYPGNNVNIKIGDANILITGKKTYIIRYKIKRAINYFDNHDELYWNITGNEWQIPILNSSANIILPSDIDYTKLQKACYSGSYGSATNCTSSEFIFAENALVLGAHFKQGLLNSYEGLTIVLGWPKGIVYQPAIWEIILDTIRDNWVLFLPLITLLALFIRWNTHGRDPLGRGVIIPEFDTPDNMTPAESGTILDQKAENKDISAELIYLATKGFLKITKKEGDYILDKLKPTEELTDNFDKELFTAIFGSKSQINLSDLEENFYKDLARLKNMLYENLTARKYFKSNPNIIRGAYIGVGIAIACIGFVLGGIFGGLGIFSLVLSGILIAFFGIFMPARTKEGVLAKEHILGLKMYLNVAEKARIEFHNAPAKNPETFEKYLPFAMVLGVEKAWAKQFEDIYNTKPDWYNDPSTSSFNSMALVNNLNTFSAEARSTLSSAPASASSGSSGFGGGGSGGGGGGGGGGSW
ncbi:DUF2207 domain-containing protein [Candidatus Falkowbacteria bacterium]|nr:DUF2207 domain-containing protein [Candidatus Falkowbacteria bacterium]